MFSLSETDITPRDPRCFLFQKRYKPKDKDDMSKTRTLTLGQHAKGWFTEYKL